MKIRRHLTETQASEHGDRGLRNSAPDMILTDKIAFLSFRFLPWKSILTRKFILDDQRVLELEDFRGKSEELYCVVRG